MRQAHRSSPPFALAELPPQAALRELRRQVYDVLARRLPAVTAMEQLAEAGASPPERERYPLHCFRLLAEVERTLRGCSLLHARALVDGPHRAEIQNFQIWSAIPGSSLGNVLSRLRLAAE